MFKFFVTQKFSSGFAAGTAHLHIEISVGVCVMMGPNPT